MKLIKSAVLALGMLLLVQGATFAQEKSQTAAAPVVHYGFSDLKAIGAGLVILGAAFGIGGLAKSAVESMARQPEIAGNIQTAMIIAAALIEGVTFFALIIILLQVLFGS
ncbi:MAG TPA: ATP synthase F0 subunit C [Isosphaeraceae bacterium]|nr:ATP synthase F0 subunit C [Isosphaeraceae bacterium]